jgi:hypothetical protein
MIAQRQPRPEWVDDEARPAFARNAHVASSLREAAALLEAQGADGHRTAAYRRGARTLEHIDEDVADLLQREGTAGLLALPNIGRGIARAIQEIVHLGDWGYLLRLRGAHDPVHELMRVPGIGHEMATRIHDLLDVDSLEELEAAAHDGRLEQVPGIGDRRAHAIEAICASVLGRQRGRTPAPAPRPPVELILEVDREYRERAAAGGLDLIAPKRFNPRADRWLPVLHTARGAWHFTALFSNTARAHELGRTRDWVVVYYHHDAGGREGQHTVVTEWRGPLRGERVVRGREDEVEALRGA